MPIMVKRISKTRIRIIRNQTGEAELPTPPNRKRPKRQELPTVVESPAKQPELLEEGSLRAPELTTSTEAPQGEVSSKEPPQAALTKPELTKTPAQPKRKKPKGTEKPVEAKAAKKKAQPKKKTSAPKGASKPPVAARSSKSSKGKSPSPKSRKTKDGK